MSGQQYQQLLQQSPYYSQVQNSPYVQPFQLPPTQSNWGDMASAAFKAPLQSDVMRQMQIGYEKDLAKAKNNNSEKPFWIQTR